MYTFRVIYKTLHVLYGTFKEHFCRKLVRLKIKPNFQKSSSGEMRRGFLSCITKKHYYFALKKTVPIDKQVLVFLKKFKLKGTNGLPLIYIYIISSFTATFFTFCIVFVDISRSFPISLKVLPFLRYSKAFLFFVLFMKLKSPSFVPTGRPKTPPF